MRSTAINILQGNWVLLVFSVAFENSEMDKLKASGNSLAPNGRRCDKEGIIIFAENAKIWGLLIAGGPCSGDFYKF